MKAFVVDVGVCWTSKTWDTRRVSIHGKNQDHAANKAIKKVENDLAAQGSQVTHLFLHHIAPEEH